MSASQGWTGGVAIVTGGAGGLGEAVVRKLHGEGVAVVVADLADERAEALANELGNKVVYVRTDVTSERDVEAAVDAAYALGTLRHVVISHGGWGVTEKVVNRDGSPASLDGFTKTLELYLTGTYNVLRLAAARMAKNDAERRRRAGLGRRHGLDRRLRGPDRPECVRRREGGRDRADACRRPRPQLGRHPAQHDRARHHAHRDDGERRGGGAGQVPVERAVPQASRQARGVRRPRACTCSATATSTARWSGSTGPSGSRPR